MMIAIDVVVVVVDVIRLSEVVLRRFVFVPPPHRSDLRLACPYKLIIMLFFVADAVKGFVSHSSVHGTVTVEWQSEHFPPCPPHNPPPPATRMQPGVTCFNGEKMKIVEHCNATYAWT